MDTELLVDNKIEDGDMLIRQLIRDQFNVTLAFWVQRTEGGLWYFYIATSTVSAEKINEAYRQVFAALALIPECSVSPVEIKIITINDPIARDAIALRDRNSSREPKRYRGQRIGNLATEEIYIYPQKIPLKVRELPNGPWEVLISEIDDVWLTCDSEDDARTIAKAHVLLEEHMGGRNSDAEFAEELEKAADIMLKYRMGFGSRTLRHCAQEVRQRCT